MTAAGGRRDGGAAPPGFCRPDVAGAHRAQLEVRWLDLTRRTLPMLAAERGWPVRNDHCFQRILLDAACGGRWYDHVAGRPAYRHLDDARLAEAVRLAEAARDGTADLVAMNASSLAWRGKAR